LNIEGINQNAEGNWALKSSNIRTLTRCIELFYREELGQICVAAEILDIQLVSKENNPQEIAKLVELILGCAVQCANKEIYIHPIMQMEAAEQAQLMHMIQNIIERFPQASPSPKGRSHHNSDFLLTLQETDGYDEKYRQVLEKISSLEIRNLDLEREKRELSDRLEHFSKDSQHWAEKVAVLEEQRDKLLTERQTSLARDNKKIQELVESEIHALSIQLEEKNDELNRVKRESGERFAHLENEVRRQADELDITKSKISQIGKLEASVAKYKKKLEEVTALKNQIKELEIHNAQYLEKVLDLESTVKTLPTLKAMVEKYKNQVVDLETANVEAISNNQIKDQKIRRLQEELDSALGGKEFLEGQLEELRTQLSGLQVAHSCDDSISMVGNSCSAADLLISTSSGESTMILREKIARLERENSELKLGNNLDPDNSHLLNELDMLRKAKESLHITMLQMKKQNEELLEENSQFKLGASKADGQAAAFSNYEEQISKLVRN
jgi:protein HOOK3